MKNYTLTVSTDPYNASRNPKFKNNETTAVLLKDCSLEQALRELGEIVSDCNNVCYRGDALDLIRGIVETHYGEISSTFSSEAVENYYSQTKKRWAIYCAEILKDYEGAGYYEDDQLVYKTGDTFFQHDIYSYSID